MSIATEKPQGPLRKKALMQQAWMIAPETQEIMRILNEAGEARFVGGCVRNALVNREVNDIDIATTLTPQEVIQLLKEKDVRHIPTGLIHGTVTAVINDAVFEITTLRKDLFGYGRHADVLFTKDWQTDASRRDFTINALYANVDGDVYDYFNGIEDLRMGRVIFIGDPETRIQEDILRILRFFRFYAHFGQGDADHAALRACGKLAHLIPKLSIERIRDEFFKLLGSNQCASVWELMMTHGVFTYFLPEGTNVKRLKRLLKLEYIYDDNNTFPLRRLAALVDVTPEGLKHMVQALKLSREQGVFLAKTLANPVPVTTTMSIEDVHKHVYLDGNDVVRSRLLLAAANEGKENNLHELFSEATTFRAPRFPLIGEDVLTLGYPAGPMIGKVLKKMENWWLNKHFEPGRTECLAKLKKDFSTIKG